MNSQPRLSLEVGVKSKLIPDKGQIYLDFTSGGIFAAVLGAGSPILRKALADAPLLSCYGEAYDNPLVMRYKDMLREFTGYQGVALFSTGSEACEAFWRLMRVYNGKPGIWGGLVDPDEVGTEDPKADAMHGWTLGSMIMAGKMSWVSIGVDPALGEGRWGTIPERTAGMIMEPYHGSSAQFHKDKPTIERISNLQKEFPEIPLCLDEIQGGFGRTGKLFAYEWYNAKIRPEFVTIGKAMGGGLPLSALLGPKDIMEDPNILKHAHLHSTHSGNPVMASVGIAVLEQMEQQDLIARSRELGAELERQLYLEIEDEIITTIHAGKGLLAGIEFKDAEQASAVVRACEDRGLLVVETGRKWVKIGPPFIITEEELEQGVQILKSAIEEVLDGSNDKLQS